MKYPLADLKKNQFNKISISNFSKKIDSIKYSLAIFFKKSIQWNIHYLKKTKIVDTYTKTGLNDVPEEFFTVETVVDGLVQNDNKIETSETIENDKNSSLKAHCDVTK